MPLFQFRQNNSGGQYMGPKFVVVKADDADQANQIAQDQGPVYFDGVADGIDCDCCGDRWYPVNDDDAQDQPSSYGYGGGVTVYRDGDNYIDYAGDSWSVKVIRQNHKN